MNWGPVYAIAYGLHKSNCRVSEFKVLSTVEINVYRYKTLQDNGNFISLAEWWNQTSYIANWDGDNVIKLNYAFVQTPYLIWVFSIIWIYL